MSNYIYFTEEQKRQSETVNLVELLERMGEKVIRSGSEYQWRDGSDKVTIRDNLWFHQYEKIGGNSIGFVCKFFNMNYKEAMLFLLGNDTGTLIQKNTVSKQMKDVVLPQRNDNMRRVFAYLLYQRDIDRDVLYTFAHNKMIYESSYYHNVVFVGYDELGIARHANMRGTGAESKFKGNAKNSIPEYSFHWNGTSDKIYLFESPIDMLSFISMNKTEWQKHSYAASCSVSDKVLFKCLKENKNIKTVYLCFDNDEPGQKANKRTSDKLFTMGIKSEILIPKHKDWNEDLLYLKKEAD